MQYDFYIITTDGIKNAVINSNSDFKEAPFGNVAYRKPCSCHCSDELITEFWNCVDQVLFLNNMTPAEFIRALRAVTGDTVYGEVVTHTN